MVKMDLKTPKNVNNREEKCKTLVNIKIRTAKAKLTFLVNLLFAVRFLCYFFFLLTKKTIARPAMSAMISNIMVNE